MAAVLSRQAQRMLADLGFERIEQDEITIDQVTILLSRRAIDHLNCQAIALADQFPLTRADEIKRLKARVNELLAHSSGNEDQGSYET